MLDFCRNSTTCLFAFRSKFDEIQATWSNSDREMRGFTSVFRAVFRSQGLLAFRSKFDESRATRSNSDREMRGFTAVTGRCFVQNACDAILAKCSNVDRTHRGSRAVFRAKGLLAFRSKFDESRATWSNSDREMRAFTSVFRTKCLSDFLIKSLDQI